MPYFTHNFATIFYTTHGPSTSRPILLLHGWTCSSTDWSFQIPPLTSLNYHLIVPDLRGHGNSSAPPTSTYSINELTQDLLALTRQLKISSTTNKLIIIGHSFGAILACTFAVMAPDLVDAIVVIDPFYGRPAAQEPEAMRTAMLHAPLDTVANSAVQFLAVFAYTPTTPEWLKTWHKLRALGTDAEAIRGVWEQTNGMEGDWTVGAEKARKFLEGRKCRRLAVCSTEWCGVFEGELDAPVGSRLEVLEGAGHWCHQQEAGRFNAILGDWLGEQGFLPEGEIVDGTLGNGG